MLYSLTLYTGEVNDAGQRQQTEAAVSLPALWLTVTEVRKSVTVRLRKSTMVILHLLILLVKSNILLRHDTNMAAKRKCVIISQLNIYFLG